MSEFMFSQSFHGFHYGLILLPRKAKRSAGAFILFFSDCDFAKSLCKVKKKVVGLKFYANDADVNFKLLTFRPWLPHIFCVILGKTFSYIVTQLIVLSH